MTSLRRLVLLSIGALVSNCNPTPQPFPPSDSCVGPAGTVICAATTALTCDGRGHARARTDCARVGLLCSPAGCTVCAPGSTTCGADGLAPQTCRFDGSGWDSAPRCNPSQGEVCAAGACHRACDEIRAHPETRGCAFWPVQSLNSALGRTYPGTTRDAFPFTVAVANPWPSTVQVTLDGGGLVTPVVRDIAAHATALLEVPWQPALVDAVDPLHRASTVARGAALHLVATAPVAAYQFNPLKFLSVPGCTDPACASYTNDASTLIPVHALGTNHVVVTMPTERLLQPGSTVWSVAPGFVSIVGTAAGTWVMVHLTSATAPGVGLPAHLPGDTLTFTLDAGDVAQILSPVDPTCGHDTLDPVSGSRFCDTAPSEDLTGTVITASAPVAVFSGHDCARVPSDRYACDHLEEQLPPVETLGSRYVVTRASPAYPLRHTDHPQGEPTAARIVAAHDGTEITFVPPTVHPPAHLDRGQSLSLESRLDYTIVSSQAILVASLLVGSEYFPQEVVSGPGDLGDPAMAIETPVDQYRATYDFFVAPDFTVSFANVVAPHGAGIRLDGTLIASAPDATVDDRDIYRLPVHGGAHHLEAALPTIHLGLRVYAYAPYTAYMYPGGSDLAPISPPP